MRKPFEVNGTIVTSGGTNPFGTIKFGASAVLLLGTGATWYLE